MSVTKKAKVLPFKPTVADRPEWHRRLEQFLKRQKACHYERDAALKWSKRYKKFATAFRNADPYWVEWLCNTLFDENIWYMNVSDRYTAEQVEERLFKRTRKPKA